MSEVDLIGKWEVHEHYGNESFMVGYIEYFDSGAWKRELKKGHTKNGLSEWTGTWRIENDGTLTIEGQAGDRFFTNSCSIRIEDSHVEIIHDDLTTRLVRLR